MSETFADENLRVRMVTAVHQLDSIAISDLMNLLAQVRRAAGIRAP